MSLTVILYLSAINKIQSASVPFLSFFHVNLTHPERTITVYVTVYVDVVASTTITILIVANPDFTIIVDKNASAVWLVVLVQFSKKNRIIIFIIYFFEEESSARSH